jgi:hypothetical protein
MSEAELESCSSRWHDIVRPLPMTSVRAQLENIAGLLSASLAGLGDYG